MDTHDRSMKRPKRRGSFAEFISLVTQSKAYWMVPVIIVVILLTGLMSLTTIGGGVLAPFIYAIF